MRQLPFRRVARFEQLANAYLQRRQKSEIYMIGPFRRSARDIVANLSCLILYGEPKINEPLRNAWERCRESAAWRACREKHRGLDTNGEEDVTPFDRPGVCRIAKYFREFFLPDLPGADEIGKYSLIFKEAPPWLLWFTNADVEAYILGIELPGLSEVSCFARGKWLVEHLPPGPFELRPLPRLGDGTNLKTK